MTFTEVFDVTLVAAPWLAATLGIGTAVAAEYAFRASSDGQPPDRWHGEDNYFDDVDHNVEVQERAARESMRIRASGFQAIATYFAAGAAVEAAAASQHGAAAGILVVSGLIFSIAAPWRRYAQTLSALDYTRAWYLSLTWSMTRKYIHSDDPREEHAAFAKAHPEEAAIIRRNDRRK